MYSKFITFQEVSKSKGHHETPKSVGSWNGVSGVPGQRLLKNAHHFTFGSTGLSRNVCVYLNNLSGLSRIVVRGSQVTHLTWVIKLTAAYVLKFRRPRIWLVILLKDIKLILHQPGKQESVHGAKSRQIHVRTSMKVNTIFSTVHGEEMKIDTLLFFQ